jgi:DNA-binding IclR family transcriptional regulator
MIFLDQVQGRHRLRAVSSVGEVFPLTVTANGRACLALLPDAEGRKLAEAEWTRGTASGDWPALARHLAQARRSGLAQDDGEHTEGIVALGFAFTDLAGD